MVSRKFLNLVLSIVVIAALLFQVGGQALAQGPVVSSPTPTPAQGDGMGGGQQQQMPPMNQMPRTTDADRVAAAKRAQTARDAATRAKLPVASAPTPLTSPDYFGIYPNWAGSPLPDVDPITGQVISGTGIRKFVNALPGLTSAMANNLGQYIPVAVADTTTYTNSDYYEIGLVQYREKMHSDLPPTLLRGYVQLETPVISVTAHSKHIALTNVLLDGTVVPVTNTLGQPVYAVDNPHYLGPTIVASKNKPTRVKFTNFLPTGSGGDLFIPTDTTAMGAGTGALGGSELYPQNRATIHLHGGATPWISDGTPHQWTTPATENTDYPKGVSVSNVPDMPDPGPGSLTFFYSNQQSARLMFYHDHAYGLTRLNVYAGEAAGYVVTDSAEAGLIASGAITDPVYGGVGIPLIIQDRTFVPSNIPNNRYPATATNSRGQLGAQDPTWDTAKYGSLGNLWFPHVYMPNQNPWDVSGANAMGRWDYGSWFWPPFVLKNGPVSNPFAALPGEPPMMPGTPNPSLVPEGFMDTPVVNGTAYPVLTVDPKAYRFRILNAANDRFFNLSLYEAASGNPMWNPDGTLNDANAGEIPMVPAVPNAAIPFPVDWTVATDGPGIRPDILDGRSSGVPDPTHMGPSWIQFGTEGGFLPTPVVLDPKPTGYQWNLRNIVISNVTKHSLYLGPAERADVMVDFSKFAGKTLIVYNDAPGPVPAGDQRNDYYTGDLDHSYETGDQTGGAPTTLPGYGPNTRTVMQIKVASLAVAGDAVTSVNMTNPGADYTAMPIVDITAPISGTTATATATGAVENILVVNAGVGYTTTPTVTISGGGAITNALATATVKNGKVTAITVVNGGAGYTSVPSIAFSGGAATANAVLAVTAVSITNPGTGYTAAPDVSFLGGGGYGAAAHAFLGVGSVYNQAPLDAAFTGATSVFATSQDPIIVTQDVYTSAYGVATYPADSFVRIQDNALTFRTVGGITLTKQLEPKAIQELFETDYGRMNATLGVEIPNTNGAVQTTIPYGYIDPVTEIMTDSMTALSPVLGDGTQIWKITHNGVDTHVIHFHLFDVQIINRVGWDGAIRPPEANELGWKETVQMNQLEDAIVAMRPVAAKLPFGVPNSNRPMDPTRPLGSTMGFFGMDPNGNPVTVINQLVSFGWEYVWHCHILGHEENDMMRPIVFNVNNNVPLTPTLVSAAASTLISTTASIALTWTDLTPATPANVGNPANEIGFRVERATGTSQSAPWTLVAITLANQTTYTDTTRGASIYRYRITAFNAAGSSTSNVLQTALSGSRPLAPTSLIATPQTGPKVALSWTDNATNESGFYIERATNTGTFTQIASVGPKANTGTVVYTDTTVLVANAYSYRVRAWRPLAISAYSNVATVDVGPNAPNNLQIPSRTPTSIALRWTINQITPTALGYEIWRSPNGTIWTQVGTAGNVNIYTDAGLARGTLYYYQVRAYSYGAAPLSKLYVSGWTNITSQTTLP